MLTLGVYLFASCAMADGFLGLCIPAMRYLIHRQQKPATMADAWRTIVNLAECFLALWVLLALLEGAHF